MSQHMFMVSHERLTRKVADKVDKIATNLGIDFVEVFDLPGVGYQRWFACPNRGNPFDRLVEQELRDSLNAFGLLRPDGSIRAHLPDDRL